MRNSSAEIVACLNISLLFFYLQKPVEAGETCQLGSQDVYAVPDSPLGTSAPFALSYNGKTYFSGNAGSIQQQCCSSGLISSWSVAMNDLGYTGALSASCSDGSELQEIRYGYNGTANSTCDWGLQLATNISNPANNTYSYKSGLILDSFLSGTNSTGCSSDSEPIGYSAASSCFALTNFQVICKESNFSSEDFQCSHTSQAVPSTALGGISPFALVSAGDNGSQVISISDSAGPQQKQCCQGGEIVQWILRRGSEDEYMGEISAECTDGADLPSVKLGYNGTGVPSCSQPLLDAYNVTTPTNGNLTYKSGSILDSFLGSNDPNSFSCQAGKVPIGFAASSSCFAVTNFQVICDVPVLGSSNYTLGASNTGSGDGNS